MEYEIKVEWRSEQGYSGVTFYYEKTVNRAINKAINELQNTICLPYLDTVYAIFYNEMDRPIDAAVISSLDICISSQAKKEKDNHVA